MCKSNSTVISFDAFSQTLICSEADDYMDAFASTRLARESVHSERTNGRIVAQQWIASTLLAGSGRRMSDVEASTRQCKKVY